MIIRFSLHNTNFQQEFSKKALFRIKEQHKRQQNKKIITISKLSGGTSMTTSP